MSSPTPPTITSSSVPDLDQVRTWLEKMIAALKFGELIVAIVALIGRMRAINLELTKQVALSRRARPRSETFARLEAQLLLPGILGTPVKRRKKEDTSAEREPPKSRKGKHPGRAQLPAHLPRVEVINAVPEEQRQCPHCGRTMTTVGHEVCEILEVEPARIVVLQRKDERVACPYDDTIVSAQVPPQIVERGKLGDTLIIEALSDKYIEHQPTERQARRFARAAVPIAPQTLGRSMAAAIDLLSPIARAIHDETRKSALLATDATGMPVLDQDHPHGIRNGTMWAWVGDSKWVAFFYTPTGDAQSVKDFLGDDLGRTVQCDGTRVTSFLEEAGGKRPGCWSHYLERCVIWTNPGIQRYLRCHRRPCLQIIPAAQSDDKKAITSGAGRQLRAERRVRPARCQKASSASRFISALVATYRPVVATLA